MTDKPHAYRRRVLFNAASTGAGNAWAMVCALVSLPLLLEGLGAATFGTWVLLQTLSAVNGWLSLADLGVGAATTMSVGQRLGAADDDGVRSAVGTSLALFVALGIGFGILVSVVGPYVLPPVFNTPPELRGALRTAIVIFGAQVLVDTVTEGCESCLEGVQRVDLSRAVDSVRRTLVAAGTVAVALLGGGLQGVAAASLAGSAVGLASGILLLFRRVRPAWNRLDVKGVAPLLRYGIKVAALDANGVLHRTIDRLLVGSFIGPSAVALVEIATQIMNGASAVLSAATYPVVSSAAMLSGRRDPRALRDLLERGTLLSLLVTWPVVALTAMLSWPLVRMWVGSAYVDAAGLTVVALLDVALVAPFQVGVNILRGVGRASAILAPAVVAVIVNLFASAVLVNAVGIVGTFIGSVVGVAIMLPFIARISLREAGVGFAEFFRASVLPVLAPVAALCAAVAGVLAVQLGDVATVALGVVLGGCAYVAVTLLLVLRPAELRDLVGARPTVVGPVEPDEGPASPLAGKDPLD